MEDTIFSLLMVPAKARRSEAPFGHFGSASRHRPQHTSPSMKSSRSSRVKPRMMRSLRQMIFVLRTTLKVPVYHVSIRD